MIDIEFTRDPSDYIFLLNKNVASAYLIAKAVRQFGGENVSVLTGVATLDSHTQQRSRNQAFYNILDRLGVGMAYGLIATDYLPPTNDNNELFAKCLAAVNQLLYQFNPSEGSSQLDRLGMIASTEATLIREIALLVYAGVLDQSLNLKPNNINYRTIVHPGSSENDPGRDFNVLLTAVEQHSATTMGPPVIWAPLVEYTDTEILESASEEGLGDIMTMVFSCDQDRPYHCGQCMDCIRRRHTFIQAGIEDNTIYECR